jgi:hypothetical protein
VDSLHRWGSLVLSYLVLPLRLSFRRFVCIVAACSTRVTLLSGLHRSVDLQAGWTGMGTELGWKQHGGQLWLRRNCLQPSSSAPCPKHDHPQNVFGWIQSYPMLSADEHVVAGGSKPSDPCTICPVGTFSANIGTARCVPCR